MLPIIVIVSALVVFVFFVKKPAAPIAEQSPPKLQLTPQVSLRPETPGVITSGRFEGMTVSEAANYAAEVIRADDELQEGYKF